MKNQLITIDGLGAERHERSVGVFEVRCKETRIFDNLKDAFNFYAKLNYPASLYDTTSLPVCLEWKVFQEFEIPSVKLNLKEMAVN